MIEYANEMLGTQQIVDVVPGSDDTPARLIFANGHTLPMLCSDCGKPLHVEDIDEFLEGIADLHLFALAYVPPSENAPEGCMEFVFAPSLDEEDLGDELPEDSLSTLRHLNSVRGIELQDEAHSGAIESDEMPGDFEGQCHVCDQWGPLNDLGLCDDCAAKLDRDLVRQRAWDYAAMVFGVAPEDRERLHDQVIAQFGEKLELTVLPDNSPPKQPGQKRRKRRSHG